MAVLAPTVSVIIPCFNCAAYIGQALDSVLRQTRPPDEIIVVDDGSSDDSARVVARYGTPVRLIRQENMGAPAARNRGLAEAKGTFVQFLDADDLLASNKLEVQLQRLEREPDAIAMCPWGRFYDRPDNTHLNPVSYWRDMNPVDWLVDCWSQGGMMHPGVWLASRELFERVGPWDVTLQRDQDGEYFCRAVLASRRVIFCDGTASYYRSGLVGSISTLQTETSLDSYLRSAESRAKNLLAAEDSTRTRRAACRTFEDFVYSTYPYYPKLWRKGWEWVERLGGPYFSPEGSRFLRAATQLLGWRAATRLRRFGQPLLRQFRRWQRFGS